MPSTARRLAAHDRQAAAGDVFEAGPRMRTRASTGFGWHDRGICSVAAATVAVQLGEQLARDHWESAAAWPGSAPRSVALPSVPRLAVCGCRGRGGPGAGINACCGRWAATGSLPSVLDACADLLIPRSES